MPQTISTRTSTAIAALFLALGALGLAACGSSSNGSSTSTSAAATTAGSTPSTGTTTTPSPPGKPTTTTASPAGKGTTTTSKATTPANKATTTTGSAPKTTKPASGAATALRECLKKNGVNLTNGGKPSLAQLQAALAKCGAAAHLPGIGGINRTPAIAQALVKFEACLRQHGVNLPKSSASGGLNTSGINTNSPSYKAAVAKCRSNLQPGVVGKIPGVPAGAGGLAGAGVPTG